jgi:hypothetical protein
MCSATPTGKIVAGAVTPTRVSVVDVLAAAAFPAVVVKVRTAAKKKNRAARTRLAAV